MSAHSYGRSSAASPHQGGGQGLIRSGSHTYESSSTSQSEAESRRYEDRRGGGSSSGAGGGSGGGGGSGRGGSGSGGGGSGRGDDGGVSALQVGNSFASSHYNDVYGDTSTSGSRTPNQAVENYFAEQPSGRNLLHVLPPGVSRDSQGDSSSDAAGLAQPSPSLGAYAEPASGRSLVHNQSRNLAHDRSGSDIDDDGGGGRGGGAVLLSPSQSEGSSAWNDTDAQSIPASFAHSGGGGARGGGGRYVAGSYDTSEGAADSGMGAAAAGGGARRSSPVVREVEVYDDDLAVSEGSDTESGLTYGSEMTYGHDTAAASSVVSYAAAPGATAAPGAPPASGRGPHEPQASPGQRFGSSGSSIASRVITPRSDLGSARQVIPGMDSWRNSNSPRLPGGSGGAVERMLSGETTDSSVMEQQARERQSSQSHEDGDFGAVWLASRAHARQYDAGGNQDEDRG